MTLDSLKKLHEHMYGTKEILEIAAPGIDERRFGLSMEKKD
jgi:hypothetical protein